MDWLCMRSAANKEAFGRMIAADPVLMDVRPAMEVIPSLDHDMVLTSGPTLPWPSYRGGQRDAIIGGCLFEGLAASRDDAIDKLERGEIKIFGCQDHSCVGSMAGIYTASMPVFVVENRTKGNVAFCNMYEGSNPRRLNYGVYDDGVREQLLFVQKEVAPVIADAIRRSGGIRLKPIIKHALNMGDELHSRNTAAAMIFMKEMMPALLSMARNHSKRVTRAVKAITDDHYFFLRLSMAAAKATADAAKNVEHSSIVTAMAYNCQGFSIRVSGLGDTWFTGPHAAVQAKLFDGHSEDEITWMGGESTITETVGLGGFAQAAAPALQNYQGGSYEPMIARNKELYAITVGENPDYLIPALGYRGTPTGIDIFRVIESNILPVMDIGIPGRDGGQIGAGIVRAPLDCFKIAANAYAERQTQELQSDAKRA